MTFFALLEEPTVGDGQRKESDTHCMAHCSPGSAGETEMSSERDQYGRLTEGYSNEACALLHEARLMFMVEFKNKFPGYGKGRAIWE